MIYSKQAGFSESQMEQMVGLSESEHCLKLDIYYDHINNEWVFNLLIVSRAEVITTLFPPLTRYINARNT